MRTLHLGFQWRSAETKDIAQRPSSILQQYAEILESVLREIWGEYPMLLCIPEPNHSENEAPAWRASVPRK